MAGVRNTSPVPERRFTSVAGPPSTLTRASPSLPRALIHLTDVPVNLNVAVAPAMVDSTAVPPLNPQVGFVAVHWPLKVTAGSDSWTCGPAGSDALELGPGAGGGVAPPVRPPPPPPEPTPPARRKARQRP